MVRNFGSSDELTTHRTKHAGEKGCKCTVCGMKFSHSSYLKTHMKTHEKPCECNVCGKRLCHANALTIHMRLHTGEKPYECSVCGKKFSDSGTLTGHMRIHTCEINHMSAVFVVRRFSHCRYSDTTHEDTHRREAI